MKIKSMISYVLIGLAAVLLVFGIIVATKPDRYSVSRSTTISAPPEIVFAQVNELKKWELWNPWGKLDPHMKLTYEGPASGVGAAYAWDGNQNVGAGRATISESRSNELVRLKMEFFKPMAGTSDAEFTFQPRGGQTEVSWSMSGKNNFICKAVSMFMSMDKMLGSQFEKGLADLKTIAEAEAKK